MSELLPSGYFRNRSIFENIEKDPELKNEIYYRSDAYRQLKFLKEYLVEIYQHNNEELNELLQAINKDITWLRKNLNTSIKRFANKIGKGYANAISCNS